MFHEMADENARNTVIFRWKNDNILCPNWVILVIFLVIYLERPMGPIYQCGLNKVVAWISDYMYSFLPNVIIHVIAFSYQIVR